MNGIEDMGRVINAFKAKNEATMSRILSTSNKLRESCSKVGSSWSGSYFGWHSRMYFRNFKTPSRYESFSSDWGDIHGLPEGWQEKQTEDVKSGIESLVGAGFSIDGFESDIEKLRSEAEGMKDEVLIAMSTVSTDALTTSEHKLQTEIENLELGKDRQYFAIKRMPKNYSTRDSEAASQGVRLPAWLYYDNIGLEAASLCESIDTFIRVTDRFSRQIQAKGTLRIQATGTDRMDVEDLHPDIRNRCDTLFSNRHYTEAVGNSFLVVRDRLLELTGYEKGTDAFGSGGLHIRGAAAPNVDKDFNEGVKFLTMAIDRFRNEKFHTSAANISDPVRAFQYLALSSLAMSFLDNAEIKKP